MCKYVHGYSRPESERLSDQADTLAGIIHNNISYKTGEIILEAGCGVGAQTIHLAKNSPQSHFISIDQSKQSLQLAEQQIKRNSIKNVRFQQADIFQLDFPDNYFDHIFVCFVLEHLKEPQKAILSLKQKLKLGGTLTVIEGDHGSFYCHPQNPAIAPVVQCLIDLQAQGGGDSLIGRRLYPLLKKACFENLAVTPLMVYVDDSKPELVEGFSKRTFIAMVEGVREQALTNNLLNSEEWERGIESLYQATNPGSTFCYTFFKAIAHK